MAVYPVDGRSTLVGFVHGEDHYRVSIGRAQACCVTSALHGSVLSSERLRSARKILL